PVRGKYFRRRQATRRTAGATERPRIWLWRRASPPSRVIATGKTLGLREECEMRTVRMAWAGLAALVLLGGDGGSTRAAPAPAPKADRWEYAELQYTASSFRGWDADDPAAPRPRGPRGGADGAGGGRGGGRGGGAGGPGGAAAQPDQPAQPVRPRTRVRWVTGDGEVEATSWEELASKLKAPEAKGA